MISEVFISPDCFEDEEKLLPIKCILNDVLHYPIFLIDFDDVNWVKYISREYFYQYKKGYRDLLGIIAKIDKKNKFFKRSNYNIDIENDSDWLDVLKLSYEEFGLDILFTGDSMISQYKQELPMITHNINNYVNEIEHWNKIKFTNTKIKKSPKDYERVFGNVLKNVDTLTVIDPYMGLTDSEGNLNKADKLSLEFFCKFLAKNKKTIKSKIIIHSKIDKLLDLGYQYEIDLERRKKEISDLYKKENLAEKRSKWEIRLKKLSKDYGHCFEMYFWADAQYNKTFHDRYLFTKAIQIKSGHSFSALDDSEQITRWSVLNSIEYENEKLNYQVNNALFVPVNSPIIVCEETKK